MRELPWIHVDELGDLAERAQLGNVVAGECERELEVLLRLVLLHRALRCLVVDQAQAIVGQAIDPVDEARERRRVELEAEALLDREHFGIETGCNLRSEVVLEQLLKQAALLSCQRSRRHLLERLLACELEQPLDRLWLVPPGIVEGLEHVVERRRAASASCGCRRFPTGSRRRTGAGSSRTAPGGSGRPEAARREHRVRVVRLDVVAPSCRAAARSPQGCQRLG